MAGSTLFNMFGRSEQSVNNNLLNMLSQYKQFKQNYSGDPKQQVQQLLDSGQMTQQQFNRLSKMATQFQQLMNGR